MSETRFARAELGSASLTSYHSGCFCFQSNTRLLTAAFWSSVNPLPGCHPKTRINTAIMTDAGRPKTLLPNMQPYSALSFHHLKSNRYVSPRASSGSRKLGIVIAICVWPVNWYRVKVTGEPGQSCRDRLRPWS